MAAEDRYISFRGLKIRYQVLAPEETRKRRVFVLSSPLTQIFSWRKILQELSLTGCETVVMDLPGFGLSACGPGVPQDSVTRSGFAWGLLDEVDRSLGSQGIWHMIAHGSSCRTLAVMASQYPECIASQTLISPVLSGDPKRLIGRITPEKWYDRNIADPQGYRRFFDLMYGKHAEAYVADAMRPALIRHGMRETFTRLLSTRDEVPTIDPFCPVMVLYGDRDPWIGRDFAEDLHILAPHAERHPLRDAGFLPMETHSHALRQYIRGWLKFTD